MGERWQDGLRGPRPPPTAADPRILLLEGLQPSLPHRQRPFPVALPHPSEPEPSPAQHSKEEPKGKTAKTSHRLPAPRSPHAPPATAASSPGEQRVLVQPGVSGRAPAPGRAAQGRGLGVTQALAPLPGCIFAAGKHYPPQRLLFSSFAPSLPAHHAPLSFAGITSYFFYHHHHHCYFHHHHHHHYYYYYYYFQLFLVASAKPGFPLELLVEAKLENIYF